MLHLTFRPLVLGIAGALLCTCAAVAHVTFETAQAAAGSTYKGVLRIGHGCEGSPTIAIRVRIPEGIVAVKPMPKPGWKLDVVTGKYPKTYNVGHGVTLSEGVTEISWSGGSLPEAFYDEFVFTATIAADLKPGQAVYFPTVQQCEKGVHRWIEIPGTGTAARSPGGAGSDHDEPAPVLRIMAPTRQH
jgi:periplasmic copper chaperone A